MDDIIPAELSDSNGEPELGHLVSKYQVYRDSKICRRYCNEKCKFNFRKYLQVTIIAEHLPNYIPDKLKEEVMQKRKKILMKVKCYIDTALNSSKRNLYDPARDDFEAVNSIGNIFISL